MIKTTAVFNYIRDNFGKKIISAQQESTWTSFTGNLHGLFAQNPV